MKRRLLVSLADQVAVSGGNFLTIALGAHFLPLSEQGKLAYAFSAYMATVLLNVAALFAIAPILKYEVAVQACYPLVLLRLQALLAISTALTIPAVLHFSGARIGWIISGSEAGALALFLVIQQFADFKRRAAYTFENVAEAFRASLWTYGLRVGLLIVLRPTSILDVLAILAGGSLVSALGAAWEQFRREGADCDWDAQKSAMRMHLGRSKWSTFNAPLSWACFFLPIFVLGALESEKAAAILVSIRSVGSVANVALELLETLVPTWFAAASVLHGNLGLRDASVRVLLVGGAVWTLGLMVIWMAGGTLIEWLLGKTYVPYVAVLLVSWVGNGIHFVVRVVGLHYRTSRNALVEFVGSLGGLAGFGLAVPLIAAYGVLGAAWAYVAVSAGIGVAQLHYLKRWVNA